MIHMQNSGEHIRNILKGMYERIAANYRSDVIRMRTLDRGKKQQLPAVFFSTDIWQIFFQENLDLIFIFLPTAKKSVLQEQLFLRLRKRGNHLLILKNWNL